MHLDAELLGHEAVTELVEHHADEQEQREDQHEGDAAKRRVAPAVAEPDKRGPDQDQEEAGVDAHGDATDREQAQGPAHAATSSGCGMAGATGRSSSHRNWSACIRR